MLRGLDDLHIEYEVNPRLVRGLDYYCHTTFEFVTHRLGAQGTLLAGGRYDGLVEQMGGQPTPGTGWAAGVERLMMLAESASAEAPRPIAMIALGPEQFSMASRKADTLREDHVVVFGFGILARQTTQVGEQDQRALGSDHRQ